VTSGVADAVAPAAEDAPPPAVDLDRPEGEPLVSGEAGEDVAIAPEMPPPPVRDGPAAAPTADDAGGEETPVSAQADTVAADHMDTAAVEEDGTAVADEGETAAEGEEPEPAAPARRRTRSARAAPEIPGSTVEVNVVVPRGLARRFDSKLIRRVVQLALEREGWKHPSTLDVTLVTDEEMREINATRRGIDEATDVLSFPMLELQPGTGLTQDFFVLPPDVSLHLGDVVISYNRVEAQAAEGGHSKERELAFLTVHAVLHILGYDHDTEPRRRQMRRREEDVLAELGLRRNGQRGGE
jgi:probable rRNA maturation factor